MAVYSRPRPCHTKVFINTFVQWRDLGISGLIGSLARSERIGVQSIRVLAFIARAIIKGWTARVQATRRRTPREETQRTRASRAECHSNFNDFRERQNPKGRPK